MSFVFTMVVLLMTTPLTTRGPRHPPHHGRPTKPAPPHHGISGSPQPSAHQLIAGTPKPKPTWNPDPPKKATSAGAYIGSISGPGAHAHELSSETQRP